MRRVVFCLVCALTVMLMGAGASLAQMPQLINYQGYLTDSGGSLLMISDPFSSASMM